MNTELLTVKEVAARLRVSDATVYKLNKTKKLIGHRVSEGTIRFSSEDVEAYIAAARGETFEAEQE